jgi:hypothetical protein
MSTQTQYRQLAMKVLVVIPYLVYTHIQVREFAVQSKDFVSNFTHLKLSWLRTLLIGVYAVLAVDALDVVTGPAIPVWFLVPSVGLIVSVTLAYFSIRVSPVFARENRGAAACCRTETGSEKGGSPARPTSSSSGRRIA